MRILALDLSTHTGFAILEGEVGSIPARIASGTIELNKVPQEFGAYPHNYRLAARAMCDLIISKLPRLESFDVIVTEETNLARARYDQKLLEFIHFAMGEIVSLSLKPYVYLNSDGADGWRPTLNMRLNKDQRKNNAKVSKAKKLADETGMSQHAAKKLLGVKGRVGKKHMAVAYANATYGLKLKQKDNNEADAIGLGTAYFLGATPCDGT